MTNYADDCSPYEFSYTTEEVIIKLEKDANLLIEWYKNNYLKPNPQKWHLLLSERGNELSVKIGQQLILNSEDEKVLGVFFDNRLNFKCHKQIMQKSQSKTPCSKQGVKFYEL